MTDDEHVRVAAEARPSEDALRFGTILDQQAERIHELAAEVARLKEAVKVKGASVREAQDAVARLRAENESLRGSIEEWKANFNAVAMNEECVCCKAGIPRAFHLCPWEEEFWFPAADHDREPHDV